MTPQLESRLGYFAPAARAITAAAVGQGATTLAVAVCGSRGSGRGAIGPQSDMDMMLVVTDEAAKTALQEKIAALPCLRVVADVGRATRRPNQPPRREDVMELSQPQPGCSAEVDATVLTLAEFRARYTGVAYMFNDRARAEEIGEADLARHHLLSGFADSRINGGTAVYDPMGIFAQARASVARLDGSTARVLFERHIKVAAHMAEHVESDWKNVFERASDQSILLDALIRAHYALNGRLCQPGYKNYPADMAGLAPDLSAPMTRLAEFGGSGAEHLRLAARIARDLVDHDRLQRGLPPLSQDKPGFLAPSAAGALLRLTEARPCVFAPAAPGMK